jgi:amino acid adenylation domain-containing protein
MPENEHHQSAYFLAQGFLNSCKNFPSHHAIFINKWHFSYSDLLEKVEIIFAQICEEELPVCIGIYTLDSIWTYAAILAISISGASYLPLNPKFPKQKIKQVIEESELKLILSENKLNISQKVKEVIIDTKTTRREQAKHLVNQDLAYLLFTSGTTGDPKGVPVSKKNCEAFFSTIEKDFIFLPQDKFLQPYELSFDVSVFSIFAAWNCGACIYVVPDEGFKYLNCLTFLKDHDITVCSMVPTVLQYVEKYLHEFSFPKLRLSFFSGDKLYQHLTKKWQKIAPNAQIISCYGPSETTIVCTSYLWQEQIADQEAVNNIVPLGKAFAGMDYLMVDENNLIVKDGIAELCFCGDQVISAYLHQKNEERFFKFEGKRYYKTGDLAQVNTNGNLIFCGRKDTQVKINGFRVELLEIENAIFELTKKNCVVISKIENDMTLLIALIETKSIDIALIKIQLSETIPAYMIPSQFLSLEKFPLNLNGKIDRQQLKVYANE